MNLKEFQEFINNTEKNLILDKIDGITYYQGICTAFVMAWRYDKFNGYCILNTKIKPLFERLTNDNDRVWWCGELNEENLSLRKTVLRIFEQYCIAEKIYRKWR